MLLSSHKTQRVVLFEPYMPPVVTTAGTMTEVMLGRQHTPGDILHWTAVTETTKSSAVRSSEGHTEKCKVMFYTLETFRVKNILHEILCEHDMEI